MTNRSRSTLPVAAPAALAYPRWVLLEQFGARKVDDDSCPTADAKTMVVGRTTAGHPIAVSLILAAPPEGSRFFIQLPDRITVHYCIVIAAHGDSVLFQVTLEDACEHFVYNAGGAATDPPRPPSLLLLPSYGFPEEDEERRRRRRYLGRDSTGFLRRSVDDFVVAALNMLVLSYDYEAPKVAELILLRSGEWSITRPVIGHYNGDVESLTSSWNNDTVIPLGDRMLCWVDLACGLMLSDVFDESPGLRYVPLPVAPCFGIGRGSCRNVCVTAGGTLKFVNIFPRCCCGGAGSTYCNRSRHAFTVHTWMLRMDDMTWVMDGMVDAAQLYDALDGCEGIRRVPLDYPVVSMDEPHAICFMVCEDHHVRHGDETVWLVMVDMKSKTIRSVFRYPEGRRYVGRQRLIPSRVSEYFNSERSSCMPDPAQANSVPKTSMSKSHTEVELQTNGFSKSAQSPCGLSVMPSQTSEACSPEARILAVLEEIPGLARDDLLKAYRILCHDNTGRRFRSLLALPMDLRKDCALLEIRASEACFICSACTAELQQDA